MRKFANVAAVAAVLVLGAAGTAGAQVYGTRGASMPGGGVPMQGYYSPYPGALYSPFAGGNAFNARGTAFANGPAFQGGSAFGTGYAFPNNPAFGGTNYGFQRQPNFNGYPSTGYGFNRGYYGYRRW